MQKERIEQRKWLVLGDIHWPKISEKSLYLAEKFLEEEKPELLILNGDIIDCESVSKYPQHPVNRRRLKEEIDGVKDLLVEFRKIVPFSKIIYVFGNHEFRIRQYLIRQAPEFFEFLNLEDLLHLKDLDIKAVQTRESAVRFVDTYLELKNWLIGHFDKCLQDPGNTAKWLMEKRFPRFSIVQAHTHKAGINIRRNLDGSLRYGIEIGCLCRLDSSFSSDTNWVNSFLLIENNKPELIFV